MAKKITFITPVGTAKYPHITEADTTGKFADGKFKTQLIVPKAEAQAFIDQIQEVIKSELPSLKDPKLPYKGDDDGNIVFVTKSKFKPLIFDGSKREVKGLAGRLAGGSKLRVAGQFFAYDTGMSLQMKQVQVLEMVDGASAMFDEAEGSFDASEYDSSDAAPTFGGTDAPDI